LVFKVKGRKVREGREKQRFLPEGIQGFLTRMEVTRQEKVKL